MTNDLLLGGLRPSLFDGNSSLFEDLWICSKPWGLEEKSLKMRSQSGSWLGFLPSQGLIIVKVKVLSCLGLSLGGSFKSHSLRA